VYTFVDYTTWYNILTQVSNFVRVRTTSQGGKSLSTSEPEQIAEKIELMRQNRLAVTMSARVRFLKDCRQIAIQAGSTIARISVEDLRAYRDRVAKECEQSKGIDNNIVLTSLGFLVDVECLLQILDRALEVTEEGNGRHWLYYKDFNFDHLHSVTRFPLLRTELRVACLIIFLYYLFTPILFCVAMTESNVCGGAEERYSYNGWVSALYFASTTMSTVGYGDLSVSQDPPYRSFIGSMYMLLSMVVAVQAFSAAASVTVSPLEKVFDWMFERLTGRAEDDAFLHERIRRVRLTRITELTVSIFTYIAIGVFAARWASLYEENEELQLSWMTSFYWAVQTTTTIGYGDIGQPDGLRYFKIFYLMFSTVLVGDALGRLGSLRDELTNVRREHAWSRRKVTKRMIDEMQSYDHDDKVDQYEFLVSSLVTLGKISSEDIRPIMDKFKVLAGPKGYIGPNDIVQEDEVGGGDSEDFNEDAAVGYDADE
jgi:hypothetical protein